MNEVSVITTSFNDAKNIIGYLDNICSQSILPNEIIIADGGSTDDTIAIIEAYKSKTNVPIRVLQKGRLNIAQGFNLGITKSNTKLVCLTCIGNSFPNDMLANLLVGYKESPCDACYGKMVGKANGKISELYNKCFVGGDIGLPVMSNRCVLYDKSVFDKVGLFLEKFHYAGEDAEFLYAFKKNGCKAKYIPEVVVYWETPNCWKEYLGKLKFYSIAELQYDRIFNQFVNRDSIFLLLVLISIITCTLCNILFLFIPLAIFTLVLCYAIIVKGMSPIETFFFFSRGYIKLFYKIKYMKYCFVKNRVRR